jgi:uncharacterized protein
MRNNINPFIVSGFAGSEYFCNRKTELKKLEEAFVNKRNVTLFSLRRMGKTALVKFLFDRIKSKADYIYVDIYSARDLSEMAVLIADSITSYYGLTFKDYISRIGDLLKSLRATISFDEYTGRPKLKFGIEDIKNQGKNLGEIIKFLETGKKRTLLVFDEFQQIIKFPEKNTAAILRTLFQNCKKTNFIFLGSNKGMIESMFADSSMPFYQSTQMMQLEEIDKFEYSKFIIEKFKKGRQSISEEQVRKILDLTRFHTYYVQYFCNRLYSKNFNSSDFVFNETLEEILTEGGPVYNSYKNLLTDIQWRISKAISKEDGVTEPYAISFIKKYDLPNISSVKAAMVSLLKKEIIIRHKGKYIIYDVFFSQWLKRNTV